MNFLKRLFRLFRRESSLPQPSYFHRVIQVSLVGPGDYPCEDAWVRADGRKITATCTLEAHYKMPQRLLCAEEVERMPGVGEVKVS